MPLLELGVAAEGSSWSDITAGDWLQIGLAVLALFGGGVVGARLAGLSRMNIEDRRQVLNLGEALYSLQKAAVRVYDPGDMHSLPFRFSPNEVSFCMDPVCYTWMKDAVDGVDKLAQLVDLLPFWDRLAHSRLVKTLDSTPVSLYRAMVDPWSCPSPKVGPQPDHWSFTLHDAKNRMTGESPMPLDIPVWVSYGTIDGLDRFTILLPTTGVDKIIGSVWVDGEPPVFGAAWDEFAKHLRRQLRPGRWRDLVDKRHRAELLWDWLLQLSEKAGGFVVGAARRAFGWARSSP